MTALPTRRDEAWRYADLEAVARAWPLPAPELISVATGESFSRTLLQDTGGIQQIDLHLAAHAKAALHILNIGGDYGRIELNVTLDEGADFTLGAAQIGGATQTLEIITTVTHMGPDATSRQIVRSVLAAQATGTYLGKVAVARGAQHTDSEQSVKAILLDRTATANAKPELEIYADDVKCAHGCAIGELDAMAMFYLQSRGLTPAEAKTLLLQAFISEVFEGAADQDKLQALALARLEALT